MFLWHIAVFITAFCLSEKMWITGKLSIYQVCSWEADCTWLWLHGQCFEIMDLPFNRRHWRGLCSKGLLLKDLPSVWFALLHEGSELAFHPASLPLVLQKLHPCLKHRQHGSRHARRRHGPGHSCNVQAVAWPIGYSAGPRTLIVDLGRTRTSPWSRGWWSPCLCRGLWACQAHLQVQATPWIGTACSNRSRTAWHTVSRVHSHCVLDLGLRNAMNMPHGPLLQGAEDERHTTIMLAPD